MLAWVGGWSEQNPEKQWLRVRENMRELA